MINEKYNKWYGENRTKVKFIESGKELVIDSDEYWMELKGKIPKKDDMLDRAQTFEEMNKYEYPRYVWPTKNKNVYALNIFYNPRFKKPTEQELKDGGDYNIELFHNDPNPSASMLDWVNHVLGKNWCNSAMLKEIIREAESYYKKEKNKSLMGRKYETSN
tara:strand:- start:97 stop:579 length:483 start_codon:yes stop_codon:yes gene_type:complete